MEQPIHLDNQDDKSNDSGVLPGHYTSDSASPLSRRSSTDVAQSSAADSHSSHDSGHQPISGDELSQMPTQTAVLDQPMIKSEPIDDHEKSTQETVGAPTVLASANNLDYSSISPDLLKCPACKFSSMIRLVFAKHLLTHCPTAQDDPDQFLRMVMVHLTSGSSSPNRDFNSQSPSKPNEPAASFVNPQANGLGIFPFFGGFPFGNPFSALGHGTVNPQMPDDGSTAANCLASAKSLASNLKGPNDFPQGSFNEETQQQQPQPSTSHMKPVPGNSPPMLMTAVSGNGREVESETVEALDLTKRVSPAKPRSRRKGLPTRLDRRRVREDSDEEMNPEAENLPVLVALPGPLARGPESILVLVMSSWTEFNISAHLRASNYCKYCDIIFSDETIYLIHTEYHGLDDPFTCNVCGVVSSDVVSFFNHARRGQH